jgi:hypothetical protein
VQDLVLVAGPASCGKSTFFEQLNSRALPKISNQLALGEGATWLQIKLSRWKAGVEPLPEQVWAEYTLTQPWLKGVAGYDHDPRLQILRLRERLQVITVWVEPEVLARRFGARQQARWLKALRRFDLGTMFSAWEVGRRMRALYRHPGQLMAHYAAWFKYCATQAPQAQWVLDNTASPILYALNDWLRLHNGFATQP